VNEGYEESCLELAEDLANQTPVRLDVLLSLSPPSVTAEQLVVPNVEDEKKSCERLVRSHSVGSVMDLQETPGDTEAERRILDMVAGEYYYKNASLSLNISIACFIVHSWWRTGFDAISNPNNHAL
jgi:hypothetical protein